MDVVIEMLGRRPREIRDINLQKEEEAFAEFQDDLRLILRKLRIPSSALARSFQMHESTLSCFLSGKGNRRPTLAQYKAVKSFADQLRLAKSTVKVHRLRTQNDLHITWYRR